MEKDGVHTAHEDENLVSTSVYIMSSFPAHGPVPTCILSNTSLHTEETFSRFSLHLSLSVDTTLLLLHSYYYKYHCKVIS